MYKHPDYPAMFSQGGKWLIRGAVFSLGLVVGTAVWMHLQASDNQTGLASLYTAKFGRLKDLWNKATQTVHPSNPSAEDQIVEVEQDLQPGG